MAIPYSFSRRVSFSNVYPDDEPPCSRLYDYAMETTPTSPPDPSAKFFGNYTYGRKRVKLPDPPSKSILKNKLTAQQLRENLSHALLSGVSYHGDLNDLALQPPESVPRSELVHLVDGLSDDMNVVSDNEEDQNNELVSLFLAPPKSSPNPPRRKSYSEMSDEELMQLDPQFSKSLGSNLNSFNFNPLLNYYGPLPRKPASVSGSSASSTSASQLVQSLAKATVYPLSNENNYPSILLTVKHRDYGRNLTTTRKVLTVVSGRRHSWNSLDWLLRKDKPSRPLFLQDGDYLIVAALVPLRYFNSSTTRKKGALEDHLHRKCERLLTYILESLPDPNVRVTITVEFIVDSPPADPLELNGRKPPPVGTKMMLYHLFSQYLPNLVIIGNKYSNLNFKYPMRRSRHTAASVGPLHSSLNPWQGPVSSTARLPLPTRLSYHHQSGGNGSGHSAGNSANLDFEFYLIRLSSYIVKYSPVPVVIVGTLMVHRGKRSPRSCLVTFSDGARDAPSQSLSLPTLQLAGRKDSATSYTSIESFNGLNQPDLSSAVFDGSSCEDDETSTSVDAGTKEPFEEWFSEPSETMFHDWASSITQGSLDELRQYLDATGGDPAKVPPAFAHSKVHHAYQSSNTVKPGVLPSATRTHSNSSSGGAYKVKSLISYSEAEEKKNEKKLTAKRSKDPVSRSSSGSSGSNNATDDKKPKKKSFLQKLGLKKHS